MRSPFITLALTLELVAFVDENQLLVIDRYFVEHFALVFSPSARHYAIGIIHEQWGDKNHLKAQERRQHTGHAYQAGAFG